MGKRGAKAGGPAAGGDALMLFSAPVREWFARAFDAPTPVQAEAWQTIARGESALVIAPTGSGKTLAAFLFAIDRLMAEKAAAQAAGERWAKGVRVLYVSPLKALGADVERNLRGPLAGIGAAAAAAGEDVPEVRTAMRTGDTTAEERRKIVRNPPDILITTPESLYLMLTSQARETLRTVQAVIVDEVHALAGDKRGAHLSLTLERLDDVLAAPAQRIGLSATVRPRDEVARFLGGPRPVRVVAQEAPPCLDLSVRVPVRDMTAVPALGGDVPGRERGSGPRRAPAEAAWKSDRALRALMAGVSGAPNPDGRLGSSSIWPHIEAAVLDEVLAHRSTIVFVNSRGQAEKLTARLNELYARRLGLGAPRSEAAGWWTGVGGAEDAPGPGMRSDMGGTSELGEGAPALIAKAHHGSVSKEKRLAVERELKAGELPCVVATSSLELGIDMGAIDLVLQVAPPPSVASGLQRVGRANHQVGGRSRGVVFPRTRVEVVDAAVAAEGMRAGAIEATRLVSSPLDVLAQQTVAAAAVCPDGLPVEDWYATVTRAACFASLPRAAFDAVLAMLSGAYDVADVAPRLVWDRAAGVIRPRPGSQRLAVTAAGTIPDRGMFSVVLPEGDARRGRRRVGELDEEMVMESRVGDVIALGTSTWRITEIGPDRVIVEPAPGRAARLPFWHGEAMSRPAEAGRARGALLRAAEGALRGGEGGAADGQGDAPAEAGGDPAFDDAFDRRLAAAGLDKDARRNFAALVDAQRQATGVVPTDRLLVVERCEDETGEWRVILHSPFGRRVHEPWALAVAERVRATLGFDCQASAADDGIIVRIPLTEAALPGAELFCFDPDELEAVVRESVATTALFAARFRECAARALLMAPAAPGRRAPLWQQRLRGGQILEAARREPGFPLIAEAARECLADVFDLPALREVMTAIAAGTVRMAEARTTVPSPFAAPLVFGYLGEHLYEGDLPHAERQASLLAVDPELLGELLGGGSVEDVLDPEVTAQVAAELQRTAPARRARGKEGLADLLRELGPLTVEQVARRLVPPRAARLDAVSRETAEGAAGGPARAGDAVAPEAPCPRSTPSPQLSGASPSDAGAASCREADGEPAGTSPDPAVRQAAFEAACATPGFARALLRELEGERRAYPALIGGVERWAAAGDAWRLREALGVSAPDWALAQSAPLAAGAPGLAPAASPAAESPLDALVARFARTNVAFAEEDVAAALGLGPALVGEPLGRLAAAGRLTRLGRGRWVDSGVLGRLRSRSLARARDAVRPVPSAAYATLLLDRQGVPAVGEPAPLRGVDGVAQVIAQFEGTFLPAAQWESTLLPTRVPGYRPSLLDELIASGEVVWVGAPAEGAAGADAASTPGRIAFFPTDSPLAPQPFAGQDALGEEVSSMPGCADEDELTVAGAVRRVLARQGALPFARIVEGVRRAVGEERAGERAVAEALAALAWAGEATSDVLAFPRAGGLAPARADAPASRAGQTPPSRRRATSRRGRGLYAEAKAQARAAVIARQGARSAFDAALAGRWSLLVPASADGTLRALALTESVLDRYGIVTRDTALLAGVPGGLTPLMPVLRSMEETGDLVRGQFVDGLGPAQFAARATVEALRAVAASLASTAPAPEPASPAHAAGAPPACSSDPGSAASAADGADATPAPAAGAPPAAANGVGAAARPAADCSPAPAPADAASAPASANGVGAASAPPACAADAAGAPPAAANGVAADRPPAPAAADAAGAPPAPAADAASAPASANGIGAASTVDCSPAPASTAGRSPAPLVVVPADDPACLLGAGIPWPEPACPAAPATADAPGGAIPTSSAAAFGLAPAVSGAALPAAARPSRREGALVVLSGGVPLLWAAPRLKALVSFTTDELLLAEAAAALVVFTRAQLKREGSAGARRKIVVETLNGAPVLDTPLAVALQAADLARLPNGLRLYADPFAS